MSAFYGAMFGNIAKVQLSVSRIALIIRGTAVLDCCCTYKSQSERDMFAHFPMSTAAAYSAQGYQHIIIVVHLGTPIWGFEEN